MYISEVMYWSSCDVGDSRAMKRRFGLVDPTDLAFVSLEIIFQVSVFHFRIPHFENY